MRKPAKRCKAKPQQVSLVNRRFQVSQQEAYLSVSAAVGERRIADLSLKTECPSHALFSLPLLYFADSASPLPTS
nr:hypothetical protein [Helicobacter bilis]